MRALQLGRSRRDGRQASTVRAVRSGRHSWLGLSNLLLVVWLVLLLLHRRHLRMRLRVLRLMRVLRRVRRPDGHVS